MEIEVMIDNEQEESISDHNDLVLTTRRDFVPPGKLNNLNILLEIKTYFDENFYVGKKYKKGSCYRGKNNVRFKIVKPSTDLISFKDLDDTLKWEMKIVDKKFHKFIKIKKYEPYNIEINQCIDAIDKIYDLLETVDMKVGILPKSTKRQTDSKI